MVTVRGDEVLPIIGFKNVGEVANGIAITEDGKEFYSATALSRLGGRFPTSRAGIYKMAEREKWPFINVPGKGAKEGVMFFNIDSNVDASFKLPSGEVAVIQLKTVENKKLSAYAQSPSVKPLVSGSGLHNGSTADEYHSRNHVSQKLYPDTIYIEQLKDIRAAAGDGQVTPTDQVSVMVAINAVNWRNRIGANADKVKIITVYGDSMEGTLSHGDQVFVDTACNKFIDDAIYVIMQDDLLRIKRVKLKLDGSILVKSDNENGFGIEEYTADQAANFKVIGKVLPFKFGQFKM